MAMTDMAHFPVLRRAQTVDPNRDIRLARAVLYPKQVWWFLVVIISLLGLLYWIPRLFQLLRGRTRSHQHSPPTLQDKATEDAAKNGGTLSTPQSMYTSVCNAIRIVLFRRTIPLGFGFVLPISQIFAVAGYMAALFTWSFINTRNVVTHENLDIKYWSNRAGNIAASQLPFVVALSSKNNLISLVTGISYEHLSLLHRWAARTSLILIWAHGFGRANLGLKDADAVWQSWVIIGYVAGVAMGILVLLSIRPVRQHTFQLFYHMHILLVIITLLGSYFHCFYAPPAPGYGYYVWPAFILWPVDRTVRLIKSLTTLRPKDNATMTLVSPTVVRLDVDTPKWTRWHSGQHVFINIPSVSRVKTTSHPFTIANAYLIEEKVPRMTFLVKAKEGVTRQMLNRVKTSASKGENAVKIHAIMDGPYGIVPGYEESRCLILIAGGTGCTFTFPMLEQALSELKKGTSTLSRIVFIWSVREANIEKWVPEGLEDILVRPSESESEGTSATHRIQIHITSSQQQRQGSESGSNASSMEGGHELAPLKQAEKVSNTYMGRPDLPNILAEEIDASPGAVSVYVSGPKSLVFSVRHELARWEGLGKKQVHLNLETYQFA